MATFRVGQRVRITGFVYRPDHVGLEATVLSGAYEHYEGGCAHDIRIDGHGLWACRPWHMEPIRDQPERNTVVSWESLPFDPRRVLEGVS